MAVFKKSYKNYDKETKGIWQKIKFPLLIALAIILFVIVISLGLTDAGLFPGNIIHRFTVSSFLEETYCDLGYELVDYKGYDPKTDYFVYECKVNGLECEMKAKNFSVQYDGYYHDYCRNTYFQEVATDYMDDFLNLKWDEQYDDYEANWESSIDIPLSNTKYPSQPLQEGETDDALILSACKIYGGGFEFTLNIYGENISFEEYKAVTYRAISMIQQELDTRPLSLQVFYHRNAEGDSTVLQYESYFWTYQFHLNEEGVMKVENVHKYVEVPADLQQKADIYYTVKNIVIIIISITVVALSALWIVRKIRKTIRYRRGAANSETDNNNQTSE